MSREQQAIKPATIVIIIASFFMIIGLSRNALGLYQSRSRLETTKGKVTDLEQQKRIAEQELKNQTDPAALDQAIRNKLNLTKPGETIVVITGTESATPASIKTEPASQPESPLHQWWRVLNPPKL